MQETPIELASIIALEGRFAMGDFWCQFQVDIAQYWPSYS